MIPLILHIKNFLSYGPETQIIDFRPYHLIALSGKNGHGKSALLDAITWAIWGQARKSSGNSKPDAGLMHLGQKHMMIILEFEVNGIKYRIRREYLQTQSKHFATLDFGIQNNDEKIVPLTDKTIKDTQEKIERTIGITYESFTNSTFLRQGQSNEFSKKSPKERKEILAQILQLQQFENQKKIAIAHARHIQQEYNTQTHIIQRIHQELAELAHINSARFEIDEKITINAQELKKLELAQQDLKQTHQTIVAQQHKDLFLQQQQQELILNVQQLTTERSTLQKQFATPHNVSKEELIHHEKNLTAKVEFQQAQHEKKLKLKEEYLQLKDQLNQKIQSTTQIFDQKKHVLSTQQATQLEQIRQLEKQLQQQNQAVQQHKLLINNSDQHTAALKRDVQQLQELGKNYEITKQQLEEKKQQYQQLYAQGTYLKQHISTIESDIQKITTECSLCDQTLDQQHQKNVHEKLNHLLKSTQEQLETTKQTIVNLKQSIQNLQSLCSEQQQHYEHSLQLQAQYTQHVQAHEMLIKQQQKYSEHVQQVTIDLRAAQQALTLTQQSFIDLEKELHTALQEQTIVDIQSKIHTIEQQAHTTAYNAQQHHQDQQDVRAIRQQIELYTHTQDQTQQQIKLQQLQQQIDILQQTMANIELERKKYINIPEQLKTHLQQEKLIAQELQTADNARQQYLIEKGALEQKQKKQQELDAELKRITHQSKATYQEMIDYQDIAKALGKDGIQALLIEQAIPEIEHETNLILARLTHNQTQIFIESLRDLKKGGSKETLDIKIADPFGLRDYEMFSGGEAFRIDFALRIGISKLLARRAGTTLQTIFIDEGFGSQDDEGISLIMDNIYKIQNDFAKIIVVSHLSEMKEHFPVQFLVEKKRTGSTISIHQQG
ncbi:SMC family ATPase [Candidatus Babeliales bacterium]|nr:SMC family ATPase [Candidatus Babeliales bacterium]